MFLEIVLNSTTSRRFQGSGLNTNKTLRFLTNKNDQRKYHINEFPDPEFVKLFHFSILYSEKNKMLTKVKKLTYYAIEKMGGLELDGWKIKTDIN